MSQTQALKTEAEIRTMMAKIAEEAALGGRARTFVLEEIAHYWGGKRNTPECAAKIRVFREAAEVARARSSKRELITQPALSLSAHIFAVLEAFDPG